MILDSAGLSIRGPEAQVAEGKCGGTVAFVA